MSKPVLEQFYSLLSGDPTLQNLLGGTASDTRVKPQYPDEPDENPLIVWNEVINEARPIPLNAYDVTVQLDAFAISQDLVEDIADRINTLLNYYKQSTSPLILRMRRVLRTDNPATDRNMKGKILRYRVWVAKEGS